jgi:hypothetical protein
MLNALLAVGGMLPACYGICVVLIVMANRPGASDTEEERAPVTDWDVALRAEEEARPAREPGRVEYRFLGVTGEEET